MDTNNSYTAFLGNIQKYNCTCDKLDVSYNISDHRCWTAIVNKGKENVLVTFHVNKNDIGEKGFDIISSKKIISDVSPDDVFDTIDLLLENTVVQEENN